MIAYKQLQKRKEFNAIREIGNRLEERDIIDNNSNYKPIFNYYSNGNLISIETGFIKKTYWFDIFYAFELLDWIRKNKI